MSDGGYLVPQEFLTGRYEDVSGPIRRFFVRLGLASPKIEWRPGLLDLLERG